MAMNSTPLEQFERDRAGPEFATIRRIRQACTRCRHRKTRCSGDRPQCVNCQRVGRLCHYDPYSGPNQPMMYPGTPTLRGQITERSSPRVGFVNAELLNRITGIEAHLVQLQNQGMIGSLVAPERRESISIYDAPAGGSYQPTAHSGYIEPLSPPDGLYSLPTPDLSNLGVESTPSRFSTLPPASVIKSLIDAYFRYVHNQPYSYFHEESFRRRLAQGLVPKCLVFAILALALKFSNSQYFGRSIREAIIAYSKEAWLSVLNDHFMPENDFGLDVAQASSILAIVDYTSGRTSSGWLKIGIAVRIAQDLQLMREPKGTLSSIEQEERRRTFWSIYLLDRIISCGQNRPPAISDEDCQVQLPCSEDEFGDGPRAETPTLHQIMDLKTGVAGQEGPFTKTILASAALGRCARYVLHRTDSDDFPPWDPRSDFTLLNTLLLFVGEQLQSETTSIREKVQQWRELEGAFAEHAIELHVFALITFHISYCLLNHPFLLRMKLHRQYGSVTQQFLVRSLHISCNHARSITTILEDALTSGCRIQSSFFAYACVVAGGIISLSIQFDEERKQVSDPRLLRSSRQIVYMLERIGRTWDHAAKIHLQLMLFNAYYRSFTGIMDLQAEDIDPQLEEVLWLMVDYSAMCSDSKLSETVLWTPLIGELTTNSLIPKVGIGEIGDELAPDVSG